jgi:hypothetical protein
VIYLFISIMLGGAKAEPSHQPGAYKLKALRLTSILFCANLCLALPSGGQKNSDPPAPVSAKADLLAQRIDSVNLENEYFAQGVAKLNMLTRDVGFTIEFLPGTLTSGPPPDPKLKSSIQNVTLEKALDWLCALDPRYSWKLANTVNIFPRNASQDPNYIFNRRIDKLQFIDVGNPNDALGMIFKPVSKAQESVVTQRSMGTLTKPFSATLVDTSVRHALNELAAKLGPGFGWMVFGNGETWIISFHDRLLTKSAS